MIALGVGIAAMAVLIAGMLLEYAAEQDRINGLRDESTVIQTSRIREDLHAKFNKNNITIQNRWGDTSTITGIVVVCNDSSIRTKSYSGVIPIGKTVDALIMNDINILRRSCP